MAAKFTTDVSYQQASQVALYSFDNSQVVAAVAFGLDGESFTNPDSGFRKMGDEMFKPSFLTGLKQQIVLFMPFMNKLLRVS